MVSHDSLSVSQIVPSLKQKTNERILMLIVVVGSSRNSCVASLLAALESVPFGDVLGLEASSAPDTEIKLSGNRETALVYSFDTLTLEPLTSEDCRKLLRPLVKHLPKSECGRCKHNPVNTLHRQEDRRLLVPSGRSSTWVVNYKNRQFFRQ